MDYRVKSIDVFERQAQKLIKKYPSLKIELLNLVKSLKMEPIQGVSIGKGCYKIRLAIASKGKGKSGGGRIITNIAIQKSTVYLLSIYDKSYQENISEKELEKLLNTIPE